METQPLIERVVCLSEISKNLTGEFTGVSSETNECEALKCTTLELVQHVNLQVSSEPTCDSKNASILDGTLHFLPLVSKFLDADASRRGVHEGSFFWNGRGVRASGKLHGITNAGTHREPPFDPCQRCHQPGVMEGMLIGLISIAKNRSLIGCELRAAYRLRFDEGGFGKTQGTLEGAIVCDCEQVIFKKGN